MRFPRRLFVTLAALLFVPSLHAQPGKMRVGINDNWINYYQASGRFNDILGATNWNTPGFIIPLGAQGIAATEGYARPGVYTLSAAGKGTIHCGISQANLLPPGPGILPANAQPTFTGKETYQFAINKSTRTLMQLWASDPKDPIRDVHIMAPGAGKGLYHPAFLASIGGFDTIRFMDPQQTSGTKEVNWADRRTVYGADIESLIELCNITNSNGWFCLPVRCSSPRGGVTDYPAGLGTLLNARLKPGLTAYVEYSNEVWNWGNPWWDETNYVWTAAAQEYDPSVNAHGEYARLANAAMNALESQIRPGGPRIKRVLARQLADAQGAADALAASKDRGWKWDCLSGAMYWDTLDLDRAAVKATYQEGDKAAALAMIDAAFRRGLDRTVGWTRAYKALADQYGVELVGYEGGPTGAALWADKDAVPIIWEYVRSPLCGKMMVDALTAFEQAGVSLLNLYSHCHPQGIWSLKGKHIDDLSDRRYRGARAYQAGAPPAIFVGTDTTTRGDWVGTYGTLGATVAGAPAGPGVASVIPAAARLFVMPAPGAAADARALQLPDRSGRVAGWWYDPTEVDLDIPAAPDGALRILSLYFVEWDPHWAESLSVQVADAASGAVLDTRAVTGKDFAGGLYLRWTIDGHATIKIRDTGGGPNGNAKVSGVFLDPVPRP